jgi:hypothetical protein
LTAGGQSLEVSRARGFLLTFFVGVLVGVAPLIGTTARLGAVGELDLFDTDAALLAESLHGPLAESFVEYKLRMASALRPDLLILGSSRVMQFRAALFDGCAARSCVYNAGGGATTLLEAQQFVDALPYAPRVLVLGLDVWQFDPSDPTNTHQPGSLMPNALERARRALGVVRTYTPRLYDDEPLRSVLLLGRPEAPGARGVRAILRGEGFRPDGSYSYGPEFLQTASSQSPEARAADALGRIERGCCRFEYFTKADASALVELERLVRAAQTRGVAVVAYMPPYADLVAAAIESDPRLAGGFASARYEVSRLLESLGVPFSILSRASDAGCRAEEMLDGLHPSEVCSARILDRLLSTRGFAEALRPFVTADHVKLLISRASSSFSIGGP